MNYLISSFDCVLVGQQAQSVLAGVKYELIDKSGFDVVYAPNTLPFLFNLKGEQTNIVKADWNSSSYYFLFPTRITESIYQTIKHKNKEIHLNINSRLIVEIDGVCICEKDVENIKFSHYESVGDLCIIYFVGKRNYLCVIKNQTLMFANYYDECNIKGDEKYFMCRLNDSLNHGRVCEIKDGDCSSYLVYLDDYELNLKPQFLPHVFLDCLIAGNLKYCEYLLCDELKNAGCIEAFFPEFDWFYPIKDNVFVLINKKTLAGLFEFQTENNKIINIISH